MKPDPSVLADWQIAEAAEARAKPIERVAAELGLVPGEYLPRGPGFGKVDGRAVRARLAQAPRGRYVDVTAITPTPLGEGKTTTVIGLVEGLGHLGCRAAGAIRQPSGGPTFNIKGTAAGGGLAQCIPMTPFSIRLTGDLDSITNAHNLAMVALTARMQHERNYDDARLAAHGVLRRLDIDPSRVQIGWAMDFCAQALRRIVMGRGGPRNGVEMESGFQISVSSEIMAILSVAHDLKDFRRRIARMVVAHDTHGREVTTRDLEVDGAMTAWMVEALDPNLLQTIEGQPVFVHAGPFANIAIGQSSIIADDLGTRLAEYVVTESGFGAEIGYEKFWNLKCRVSGLRPDAVVLVATIRALKMHGGGPRVRPGMPLDEAYTRENLGLLEAGCANLEAHIEVVRRSGIRPVVCLNHFHADTEAEIAAVRRTAGAAGARFAVSRHWKDGGEGAAELAEAVIDACREPKDFRFFYEPEEPHVSRIERMARELYGAAGVTYSDTAREKLREIEADAELARMGTCMAKTQLSLSHDPDLKGRPRGWTLPIRDFLVYRGAGFVVPVAGDIPLMPGTGSDPGFRRIDVDTETGRVRGL